MLIHIMLFRYARVCLLMLLVAALTAVSFTQAPQRAAAATVGKAANVRVVYGDRMLTVAWSRVAGATGYKVQYGTNSAFKRARTTAQGDATTVTLKNVTTRQKYYLRVITVAGRQQTYSSRVSATPQAGYPSVMPTVTVKPGQQPNQITVSWTRLQRATRVVVLAGSDNQESASYFHSAWLPATATSTTLTVPAQYQWLIGSGTGNAIYVKVGQYNSLSATQIRKTRSDAAMYRLSLANTYGFATPLPVNSGSQVKVATYNVQSVAASAPGHPWSERRSRAINNILYSGADLIGLQEADAAKSMDHQHRQIAHDLAPHGYAMSGDLPADYKYDFDVTDSWLYYNTDVLTRLDGGIVSPRDQLHIDWPAHETDRRGTWAKFKVNATGKIFYALNMHLPAGDNSKYTPLRIREAAALSALIQTKADGAPIVFMGDLNAAPLRDGYCASSKLRDLGWYDTASTLKRANWDLQTVNAPVPYPTGKPERALNVNKGRIDYILTLNMGGALSYQNQNVLNADGTPNLTYQGSDHNLQAAVLAF